jgi:adenylate kinase
MNRIIQLIGIPGAGKSYLFRRIGVKGINYIEFGTEFKEWVAQRNGCGKREVPNAPKEYVREFIDIIIQERQPAIFTSHIVNFDGREFHFDPEMEIYTASGGYIYVASRPEDILARREKDNQGRVKMRYINSLEDIAKHQDISLQLSREFACKLGSKFMEIKNLPELEEINLTKIRSFVQEVLLL